MSLSRGALNVQLILQKLFRFPFTLKKSKTAPDLYFATATPFKNSKIAVFNWRLTKFMTILHLLSSLCSTLLLLGNLRSSKDVKRFGYLTAVIAIESISLAGYTMIETFRTEICYLISQRLKLVKTKPNTQLKDFNYYSVQK